MMSQFLRIVFGNLSLKIVALIFALFLWSLAVLDRTYEVKLDVPVKVVEKGRTERVITDVDTRVAVVALSGKGKELMRVRRSALEFTPVVPEGKFGTKQVRLQVSELKLPPGVIVRAIEPEMIEVKLGPAQTKEVAVLVPTKNQPTSGMMVSQIKARSGAMLVGLRDGVQSYTAVSTETLDLSTVQQGEIRRLRVVPPATGITCVPESIDVEVVLEKEAARIFLGLPVQVLAPPTIDVEVVPDEAQIAVAGPANRIDSLKPSDIAVQIKISGLGPGSYRLGADVKLPERFRMVKIEPQLFDVTIR
jgi:YbbR domain-containing protein